MNIKAFSGVISGTKIKPKGRENDQEWVYTVQCKLWKIAKMLGVLKWIRNRAKTMDRPSKPSQAVKIIQMDEMWHFVNGKKKMLALEGL